MTEIAGRDLSPEELATFARCEEAIQRGMGAFIETARALLEAEKALTPKAFDTFCRVHAGAPAAEVRPILDLVRESL